MSKIILGDVETGSIDRLYLELSQFTKAKTKKEIDLGEAISKAYKELKTYAENNKHRDNDVLDAIATLRNAMTYLVND